METKGKQKEYQWMLDLKNDELVYMNLDLKSEFGLELAVQYITVSSRISKQKQENRDKKIDEILEDYI